LVSGVRGLSELQLTQQDHLHTTATRFSVVPTASCFWEHPICSRAFFDLLPF
jgi:hypothetical protein